MAVFDGTFGLQFTPHLANRYTLPDLVRLASLAADLGFEQIWVNDNLRYRSQSVVLTAIATHAPIRIGTAILVPYLQNPAHVAGLLATISEATDGREVSVGIARGDLGQLPRHVEVTKPIGMVTEMAGFLRTALRGGRCDYADYPLLRSYYHLQPTGSFRLGFDPGASFRFYGGGNGPQSLRMTGRVMDGLITSGTYIPTLRSGRLPGMLEIADRAAVESDPDKRLDKVCEINVSIARDGAAAMAYPKPYVAHAILQWEAMGFDAAEYARLGVERADVLAIRDAFDAGATIEEASSLVTEPMVRAQYAAGTPDEVVEQVLGLVEAAGRLGYGQVAFAKLGPDYAESIRLLAETVVPALRGAS
jgi:alkanesulfonate monooxygenase SsuD/methylene tetrahydromethanopterin reductase-like flavin-dependent oxidoreductase (luciferase family)